MYAIQVESFADEIINVGDHIAGPNKMTQHRGEAYWNANFNGRSIDGLEVYGYVIIDGNVFFEIPSW
jgi:hypothetical protein